MGTCLSEAKTQEEGFPQGGVLAVTLFLVKVNAMADQPVGNVDKSLFVDDFNINYSANHMHVIERRLQHSIDKIERWATNNGFKLSLSKTKCMHFCKRRGCTDPELYVGAPKSR